MRVDMSITEKSQVKFDLSIAELHDFFFIYLHLILKIGFRVFSEFHIA